MKAPSLIVISIFTLCGSAFSGTSLTFHWTGGGLCNSAGVAVSTSNYVFGFGTFTDIPEAGDSFTSVSSAFDEVVSATADNILLQGTPGFFQMTFRDIAPGDHDGRQVYLFARNTAGTEYGVFTTGVLFGNESSIPPITAATFTAQIPFLQTIIGGELTGPEIYPGVGPSHQLLNAPTTNEFSDWILNFNLDPSDRDFEDDPDGDCLANGLEAWFGTDPGKFNAGLIQISSDGITTTFAHPLNPIPVTNVGGSCQWSNDLVHWFASGNGPAGGPTVSIGSTTMSDNVTVSATASEPLECLFLRAGARQN